MESSRSGPLTTFIMTLPLIVVPAIAMLKPADSGQGFISSILSASSGQVESAEMADSGHGNAPKFNALEDEFDALFSESSEDGALETGELAFQEDVGNSLVDNFVTDFGSPETNSSPGGIQLSKNPTADPSVDQLLVKLTQMGASRTIWFSPDGTTVGFVAFFPTGPGTVSYRFASMAESKVAAVQDVMQQARAWQDSAE
jgi:hypothetical protein